jgi:hypothetical protein
MTPLRTFMPSSRGLFPSPLSKDCRHPLVNISVGQLIQEAGANGQG